MKLSLLAAELGLKALPEDKDITFITDNSAKVCDGSIFVCIEGKHFDGHTKAAEALENGAAAVVVQKDMGLDRQLIVDDTRAAYTKLCAAFYSHPEQKLDIIGITGTNGKTTSCFIIHSVLERLGCKTGMIGTVKNITGDKEYPASLTTPDPYELFRLFAEMVESGCRCCVMEVSSQALAQKRVEGVRFKAAVFTNLTRDHLDYHGTFENYAAAKHLLFENSDLAVINVDDEAAQYMLSGTQCRNVTFSAKSDECDYSAKNIRVSAAGVKYELVSNDNIGRVDFAVPGEFSVYNSMGAAVCLVEMGYDFREVLDALSQCGGVPGRMELVKTDTPYSVIIDYAHTPDGLENVLTSVREITDGRVICVFGCGGDRDKTKRPVMGEIGARLADFVIVTSDNPRTEKPEAIINDILVGLKGYDTPYAVIPDRVAAIHYAMDHAQPGDVIVLAGKGHEDYQEIDHKHYPMDERVIVAEHLKETQK